MAKLIFSLDGNVVNEYALDKARVTIGRRASNDIHIDNLAISGQHAVVVTTDEGSHIEDLNSTNGVVVNQKKIKKHHLEKHDVIRLGKYKVQYVNDASIHQQSAIESTVPVAKDTKVEVLPEAPPSLVEATMPQAIPVEEEAKKQVLPSSNTEKRPRLHILNGKDAGSNLLLDKAIVKIGRPNEQLALVTKRTQGYFLSHVVGDATPLVNGKPIDAHASVLNNRDEIEVLGIKMALHLD